MTTTWDPAHSTSNFALSGGNLTATCTATGGGFSAFGSAGYSTGKRVVSLSLGLANNPAIGLGTPSSPTSSYIGNGGDTTNIAWWQGGQIQFNGSTIDSCPSWGTGDLLFIAIDFSTGSAWLKKGSGGTWVGTGNVASNPDAGSGGYNFTGPGFGSGVTGLPACSAYLLGDAITLDPTATGHGLSSFTSWDAGGGATFKPAWAMGATKMIGAVFQ